MVWREGKGSEWRRKGIVREGSGGERVGRGKWYGGKGKGREWRRKGIVREGSKGGRVGRERKG